MPLLLFYLLGRTVRDRRYFRNMGERLGFLPPSHHRTVPGAIWLHAVSVGELLSALELVRRLPAAVPGAAIFISTTTLTGRAAAEQKLAGVVDGVFYLPFDYVSCVRRVLRAIRPSLVVILETEIWPNLFREVKRSGASLLVVNGRISDRAIGRYRAQRWFFKTVLAHADEILVQGERDRERYIEAGAPPHSVHSGGNLKYDFEPVQARVPEAVDLFIERTQPAEVWIAASTSAAVEAGDPDEDDAVIEAFRTLSRLHPRLLLLLAPRKPERFDTVAQKLTGLFALRRSQLDVDSTLALPGVLLVDSIGELGGLFRLGDVVFMGGTLPHRGGHNILEPAIFGRPVIAGPHMQNFAAMAEEFTAAGALLRVENGGQLAASVDDLLRDAAKRREIGKRALALALSKRGATDRAIAEIRRLHEEAAPHNLYTAPGRLIRRVLACAWVAGSVWHQARLRGRFRRLSTPVISVGGLCMGGAGKTPFVLWLAQRLRARGAQPAILTRGYRRRSPEAVTVIPRGGVAPIDVTGDEAQIMIRAQAGAVGISAERFHAGSVIEEQLRPSVFVLDDGFQHVQLGRDFDIVLIDSLDPFAGGGVFPLGRLREQPEALRRADAIILTRTEPERSYAGLLRRLRELNPAAPVFRARVEPIGWHTAEQSWAPAGLPFPKLAAFCGLANPAAFWRTLAALQIQPALAFSFEDHHTYRPRELLRVRSQAMQAGAKALLTTEKDFMNLPADAAQLVAPLALCWLRIGVVVDDEEALLNMVERASSASSRIL